MLSCPAAALNADTPSSSSPQRARRHCRDPDRQKRERPWFWDSRACQRERRQGRVDCDGLDLDWSGEQRNEEGGAIERKRQDREGVSREMGIDDPEFVECGRKARNVARRKGVQIV